MLAQGTKTTTVIPAGALGNEQPITIMSEQWFSPDLQVLVMTRHSDPRTGETTYRLANVVRGAKILEVDGVDGLEAGGLGRPDDLHARAEQLVAGPAALDFHRGGVVLGAEGERHDAPRGEGRLDAVEDADRALDGRQDGEVADLEAEPLLVLRQQRVEPFDHLGVVGGRGAHPDHARIERPVYPGAAGQGRYPAAAYRQAATPESGEHFGQRGACARGGETSAGCGATADCGATSASRAKASATLSPGSRAICTNAENFCTTLRARANSSPAARYSPLANCILQRRAKSPPPGNEDKRHRKDTGDNE